MTLLSTAMSCSGSTSSLGERSGGANVIPLQVKSCTHGQPLTDWSQGIDCIASKCTHPRQLGWSSHGTVQTARCTTKDSAPTLTTVGRPFSSNFLRKAKSLQVVEYIITGTKNIWCIWFMALSQSMVRRAISMFFIRTSLSYVNYS